MNCEIEKSGVITIRLTVVNTLLLQNGKQMSMEMDLQAENPVPTED